MASGLPYFSSQIGEWSVVRHSGLKEFVDHGLQCSTNEWAPWQEGDLKSESVSHSSSSIACSHTRTIELDLWRLVNAPTIFCLSFEKLSEEIFALIRTSCFVSRSSLGASF